jgi:5'-nucleotidase
MNAVPTHPHLRILLCNDDGVHAPGLKTLEKIARQITDDIWVVAPEHEQSGVGHSLSLRRPLRLREISPKRYAVDGTPTDCIVLALKHLMLDHRPDLVLSGVNNGGNLGEDVTYSGTVAAAMEATLLGVPAIAFSQAKRNKEACKWATAECHGPDLVRCLLAHPWREKILINVNFPNIEAGEVEGIRIVSQGERLLSGELVEWKDPHGETCFWIGALRDEEHINRDTDLWAVQQGYIAVTPLHLDLTHYPTVKELSPLFLASLQPFADAFKNSSGRG